jgi:pimeloyl-[acyl-carrier protein] methyl ester esterase
VSVIYSEVHGAGPPLLLIHGWALNVRVWDSLLPSLITRFKVVAVDLAGHGRSAWQASARNVTGHAQLVADTCVSLDIHNPTILGWSLGGQVALALTALMPVDKLILASTTPNFAASDDWPYGMSAPILENFARQLETDYERTISDFLVLQARGSANSESVLQTLHSAIFAHGEAQREALTEGLKLLAASDLRSQLPTIKQHAVVIAGQYDRVTPPAAGQALAQMLPHAKYVEIRRAGHAPFLSHPTEFIDATR